RFRVSRPAWNLERKTLNRGNGEAFIFVSLFSLFASVQNVAADGPRFQKRGYDLSPAEVVTPFQQRSLSRKLVIMDNGRRAKVAITHTKEKHRSIERVQALVEAALLELGGSAQFFPPGATVFIKPNQTVYYSAEEGCTTDPLVVGALIRIAKENRAGRIIVGDS